MSDEKVYKTRECTRRAQKAYTDRLKNSDNEEDHVKWEELWKRKSNAGRESMRRMYANPEENMERLERVRAQKRDYARRKRENASFREKCNTWQREYRSKKKQIE